MLHTFPVADICRSSGADPQVCGRPPGRPRGFAKRLIFRSKGGTWASSADLGVCPTIYASVAPAASATSALLLLGRGCGGFVLPLAVELPHIDARIRIAEQ